jgi:multidrug resistance efflux pump
MIRKALFYIVWITVVFILVFYSIKYQGGDDAMVAQVESDVTAISYQKPVLIKKIHITPGQVVDSGDLLIEVERPDLKLDYDRKVTEKMQAENGIGVANSNYRNAYQILTTNYQGRKKQLQNELGELQHRLRVLQDNRRKLDDATSLSFNSTDSLLTSQIDLVEEQLRNLEFEYSVEKKQLQENLRHDTVSYRSELAIIDKELNELVIEQSQLQKKAQKRSTIGNVFVQLDELVPSFTTLVSLYDINPTLIKAFVSEHSIENLRIGARVFVESVHREYRMPGRIIEIGSRITAYPDKINPLMNQNSYGQEVFISIPVDNDFLNGEKVYVYIADDE